MNVEGMCRNDCVNREIQNVIGNCALQRFAGNAAFNRISALAFQGCFCSDPQVRADYLHEIRTLTTSLIDLTDKEKSDLERYINLVGIAALNCCSGVTLTSLILD